MDNCRRRARKQNSVPSNGYGERRGGGENLGFCFTVSERFSSSYNSHLDMQIAFNRMIFLAWKDDTSRRTGGKETCSYIAGRGETSSVMSVIVLLVSSLTSCGSGLRRKLRRAHNK